VGGFTYLRDRRGMTGWNWIRTVLTASVTAGCATAAVVALTATSDERYARYAGVR